MEDLDLGPNPWSDLDDSREPINPNATSRQSADAVYIKNIEVDGLFGGDPVRLINDPIITRDSSSLIVLYGKNGTGKTTILTILYHIFLSKRNGGHKTRICSIPFKRFYALLSNGFSVEAARESAREGNYTFTVSNEPNNKHSVEILTPRDVERLGVSAYNQDDIENVYNLLKDSGINFNFLGDDRKITATRSEPQNRDQRWRRRETIINGDLYYLDTEPEQTLSDSIKIASRELRNEKYDIISSVSQKTDNIYANLIERVGVSDKDNTLLSHTTKEEIFDALDHIKKSHDELVKFGLANELEIDQILTAIEHSRPENLGFIAEIMSPYMEGVKARLEALSVIKNTIENFEYHINRLYSNAKVRLDAEKGLSITGRNGPLSHKLLSSGEKQLLFLMTSTVGFRSSSGIIIIDEPEISLNPEWQRELIQVLSDLTSGSFVQFIIATHSFEIASQYRENVSLLQNVPF